MLVQRSCLRLFGITLIVGVLLVLSAADAQPIAFSGSMIAALLPKIVNLSVTKYDKTPANPGNMASQPMLKKETTQASGFIIDPSGLIVTNRHAVADAADVTVILEDGTQLRGIVLAVAEPSDIALLKVNPDHPLPTVTFGDSDKLHPGDPVYVIGNPFGLGSTVTSGIISALERDTPQSGAGSFIQIDAPINRGNSGGPVVDVKGDVVAVSTALFSPGPQSGFVGIGYAIPANDARFIIDRLRTDGHVSLGWIGAHVQAVTADIASVVGFASPNGSIVLDVGKDTPAARAGIEAGDIILKVGDEAAPSPRILNRQIGEIRIGSTIHLTLWRAGAPQVLPVVIGETPARQSGANSASSATRPHAQVARDDLGLVVGPITDDVIRKLDLAAAPRTGVAITGVLPASVAADHAMKPGMVILNIDRLPVTSVSDVRRQLDAARTSGRRSVLLLLEDQHGLRWVALPLSP